MYTTNENKINNIVAGVTGSLLCELSCGDIASVKEFRKELKDIDCFKAYDSVFGTFYNKYLNMSPSLDDVRKYLTDINNLTNYKTIQFELKENNITCCGYSESGRNITIYNNIAQLTIDCSKPTGPQVDKFLKLWA